MEQGAGLDLLEIEEQRSRERPDDAMVDERVVKRLAL